jgi:hypothetical protein
MPFTFNPTAVPFNPSASRHTDSSSERGDPGGERIGGAERVVQGVQSSASAHEHQVAGTVWADVEGRSSAGSPAQPAGDFPALGAAASAPRRVKTPVRRKSLLTAQLAALHTDDTEAVRAPALLHASARDLLTMLGQHNLRSGHSQSLCA